MTHEEQLKQLLTEAEQVTAKMREALRHLPDYQPQPKLATTYKEVVEAVKPLFVVYCNGETGNNNTPDPYQLPTEAAAKQAAAFTQIKNLEAYCADRFEGERKWTIVIDDGYVLLGLFNSAPFKFKKEAAEFVMKHFPEIFKQYYGVE